MCLLFDSTSLIVSFVFLLRTCECCTQIDLSDNVLCGINKYGQGNYNADGIKAIAQAISVSASLTSIDVSVNGLGDEGAKHITKGIAVSASLTSIDLYRISIGPAGAKYMADAIASSASLTKVLAF